MNEQSRVNMLRPEQMQIYVRVAELASFTQAADSLGLPKASVSQAVQQLEASLGTRLLHRTTRRVQPTQDGQVFYERCKELLAQLEDAQTLFKGGQALRGRLRVDMPSGAARQQVLPRLGEFLAAHPALEVELSSTDRRVDLVREGFDCVLRVGLLEDSALVARPLGRMAQINCASPAYLAKHGTPQTLDDLKKQHRLVHYVPTLGAKPVGWEYVVDGETHTLPMPGVLTVNDTGAYTAACVAGLGLIQAPAYGMRPLIEQGLLVEVLAQWRAPALPVSLVYANRRQLPRRAQVFMDWLAGVLMPELQAM